MLKPAHTVVRPLPLLLLPLLFVGISVNRILCAQLQTEVMIGDRARNEAPGGGGAKIKPGELSSPFAVDFDSKGNMYLADIRNKRVRVIDMKTRSVSTVAGNGKKGVPADGSVATESTLVDPRAVAVDAQDNVYILERGGHALRVVKPDGRIFTLAGTGKAGKEDGPGKKASFKGPKHLCIAADGETVIIADEANNLIRSYDPGSGEVTTILGGGVGEPGRHLYQPHGVTLHKGKLYISDAGQHRILRER